MPTNTILGVGSPSSAEDTAETPALSAVPLRPPRVENAAAFDNSNFTLNHISDMKAATRLLRKSIEDSGLSAKDIAGISGLNRVTVWDAKSERYPPQLSTFLRILNAAGARLYVGLQRKRR